MRYWDDMHSKGGFSDGEAVPSGAEHYRTAYILAVNRLAEQLESTCRVVAFNRPGMHNWCLILYVKVDDTKGFNTEQIVGAGEGLTAWAPQSEVDPDTAMMDAVDQAQELGIDGFVTCRVSLSKASIQELLRLKPSGVKA